MTYYILYLFNYNVLIKNYLINVRKIDQITKRYPYQKQSKNKR